MNAQALAKLAAAFTPEYMTVEDTSDGCGSKFKVIVVSSVFDGQGLLDRQVLEFRLVFCFLFSHTSHFISRVPFLPPFLFFLCFLFIALCQRLSSGGDEGHTCAPDEGTHYQLTKLGVHKISFT